MLFDIFVYTLSTINLGFFCYSFYISVKQGIKVGEILRKKSSVDEQFTSKINQPWKTLKWLISSLLWLILFLVFLLLFLSPLWMPILIWVRFSVFWGVVLLVFVSLFGTYIKIKAIKKKFKDRKHIQIAIVNDSIFYFLIIQIAFVSTNLKGYNIEKMIHFIYSSNLLYKETLMVILPVIIYSLLLSNVYSIIKKIEFYKKRKDLSSYSPITIRKFLFVFIIAGFIGLYTFNNIRFTYITDEDIRIIEGATEITISLLTALIIPLAISFVSANNSLSSKWNNERINEQSIDIEDKMEFKDEIKANSEII